MKRRDFIKAAGAASAGSITLARKAFAAPHAGDEFVELRNRKGSRSKLGTTEAKSVLIIGGGLAGLSSAYELSKRGYRVDLREAAPYFGGRLHTREETLKTGTFRIEHGLHMWFHQYYNMERILRELGTWERYFVPFEKVFYLFEDYKPETISSVGPYPLNLARIVLQSPNLNLLDAAQTFGGIKDVIFYDHDNLYKRFDGESFVEWADRTRINKDFYNIVMEPASSVTLNAVDAISAAEMILYMHYFFIGNPKAFNRKIPIVDHGQAVIDPLVEAIRKNGGEASTDTRVGGLRFVDGRPKGLIGEDRDYDYVILAPAVRGIQDILNASEASDDATEKSLSQLKGRINLLRTAPSYRVLRVWFDLPTAKRQFHESVIETPQFKPINLVVIYHMIEMQSKEWAERTGGSIIEFHLYSSPQLDGLDAESTWQSIRDSALKALPELGEAKPLDFSMGTHNDFTSFEVGQGTIRPDADFPSKCGLSGLMLAGDWIKTDFPSALMERATATGIEAANIILESDDIDAVEIKMAKKHGPGLIPQW